MQKINIRYFSTKRHKGRVTTIPVIDSTFVGDYSIISVEPGRISTSHINSIVLTLKRLLPTGTTIIPRISGYMPVTKKPLEVRMGKGKGSIAMKIARVRTNTVIIEIGRTREVIPIAQYFKALKAAASKLPVRTKIIATKTKVNITKQEIARLEQKAITTILTPKEVEYFLELVMYQLLNDLSIYTNTQK